MYQGFVRGERVQQNIKICLIVIKGVVGSSKSEERAKQSRAKTR